MIKRSRDSKFIIYQVLYIFIVSVLALKGAEINLGEVVKKENVVKKSVRDSLLHIVDSLSVLGLKFNIEVDTNAVFENKKLIKKLQNLNSQVVSLSKEISILPKVEVINSFSEKKSESITPSPFSTNLAFLKYANNSAENKGDYKVSIIDPKNNSVIVEIPPRSKIEFELGNQDKILLKYNDQEEFIKVEDNFPPEITITKVTKKMNKQDIYVKELQRTTCFNVVISDERIEQIKVNFSGPISVSKPQKDHKGNLNYNVSLKLVTNEDRYSNWIDRNEHKEDSDGKFKVNFFFTVLDTKSKQKVEVGESFYFTDFSK